LETLLSSKHELRWAETVGSWKISPLIKQLFWVRSTVGSFLEERLYDLHPRFSLPVATRVQRGRGLMDDMVSKAEALERV